VLGFFSVTLHHLLINTGQQYVTTNTAPQSPSKIHNHCLKRIFSLKSKAEIIKVNNGIDKIRFKQWLCILLGLCGAVLVVSGDHGFGVPSPYSWLKILEATAVTYCCPVLISR
jgi:hypothetical protein